MTMSPCIDFFHEKHAYHAETHALFTQKITINYLIKYYIRN